jgi:hypothetical protein
MEKDPQHNAFSAAAPIKDLIHQDPSFGNTKLSMETGSTRSAFCLGHS